MGYPVSFSHLITLRLEASLSFIGILHDKSGLCSFRGIGSLILQLNKFEKNYIAMNNDLIIMAIENDGFYQFSVLFCAISV